MDKTLSKKWMKIRPRLAHYLPPNLYRRLHTLPDSLEEGSEEERATALQALLDASNALTPLHRVLVDYMPRYLLSLDLIPNQPHGEIVKGSFIFADVSGFTSLTEMLARTGEAKGREVMNQIMNRFFSAVLDPITASGGDLLIFVGDAALVFFPQEENGNDVLQAIRAALRMQRSIVGFETVETEFGNCSLTMSIGLERGSAYTGVVGTPERMELLVSGPATFDAIQAETQAQSGQILLGPNALELAKEHFSIENDAVVDDLGDNLGDYELSIPTRRRGSSMYFGRSIPEILETLETNLQRVERLAPFLPEDMLALLVNTDRRRRLQSEFRPVAVQFINIIGIEAVAMTHGPELATQVFQQYFTRVKQITAQHEGIISQIDAYNPGFFFLNTFGVPKSHEGTTRYAISAALQMAQALDRINKQFELDPPLQQCGGITYGLTFNGEIGATYRRESVIAGPAVNRAARLMSKAEPGQIILDSNIWEQVHHAFVGEELPPVQLKGITGDVVVVNVKEIRRGTVLPLLDRPILEREKELGQLEESLIALLKTQQSNGWMLVGETGIGKTTLLASFAEIVQNKTVTLLVGHCQPHSKHIPLFCWFDLFVGWLEIDLNSDLSSQHEQLHQKLTSLDLLPFENELAELLLASYDVSTTRSDVNVSGPTLILELLEHLAKQQPLVIVLEDVHWLDSESKNIVTQLLAELDEWPILFILTGHEPLVDDMANTIHLPPLTDTSIKDVMLRAFNADVLNETLSDWISQKVVGNPLYAIELCRALHRAEAVWLDKSTGELHWTGLIPSLPLTLHELLLAQLDEMPLTQQEILKRAAVFGLSFDDDRLWQLCQPQIEREAMNKGLEKAIENQFLTVRKNIYHFIHPLMQEAIYTTLSFQQRQKWHGQVADWLVDKNSEQHLEAIVYHYMNSDNARKAAQYGLLAGDKARSREAYTGALDYYQQVYGLVNAPRKQRREAVENQADVLTLQGQYNLAIKLYPQATHLGSKVAKQKQAIVAGDLDLLTNHNFNKQFKPWAIGARAWLLGQQGQTTEALEIAQPALANEGQGPAHTALTVLVQNLEIKRVLEPYERWVERFVNAILNLGMSTIDLLDMPTEQSELVNKLTRKRRMTVAQLAEFLQKPVTQVQLMLNDLMKKGHVKQIKIKGQVWYKAQFARKAKKKLSSEVWSALDL